MKSGASDAAKRMLKVKKLLIARLEKEIRAEQRECRRRVARIRGRIVIAAMLVKALNSGMLKP